MSGSAGVMAIVLAETVAGSLAFLWLMPLWREVKRGFFVLCVSIIASVAGLAWLATSAAAVPGDDAGGWAVRLEALTFAAIAVSLVLLLARRARAGRIVGIVSVVPAVATLLAMAATGRQSFAIGVFQALAAAAFLGSVTVGLLLGHWYLTDRGLGRAPIDRMTTAMLVSVVVEAVAVISGGFHGTGDTNEALNPLLTAGALAPWIALGMVASTLLIAALTRATLRGTRASAVQSATGFYYLAVVTAFTAQVAVTTRFLPA